MKNILYTQIKTFLFLALVAWLLSNSFSFVSSENKDINVYLYLGIIVAIIVTAFLEHCAELTRNNTYHFYRYKPDLTMFYFRSLSKMIFCNYILNISFMVLVTQYFNTDNNYTAYRFNGELVDPVFSYGMMFSALISFNLFNFSILKTIICNYATYDKENEHFAAMREINLFGIKDIGTMFNNSTFTNLEACSDYEKQGQAKQDAVLAYFA